MDVCGMCVQDLQDDKILCCCDVWCIDNDPPLPWPDNGACCPDFYAYCPELSSRSSDGGAPGGVEVQRSASRGGPPPRPRSSSEGAPRSGAGGGRPAYWDGVTGRYVTIGGGAYRLVHRSKAARAGAPDARGG